MLGRHWSRVRSGADTLRVKVRSGPLTRDQDSLEAVENQIEPELERALFVSQRVATMLARSSGEDLAFLNGLIEAGKVRPGIDRTYPLVQAAEALRYLETGHARGKVVVTV